MRLIGAAPARLTPPTGVLCESENRERVTAHIYPLLTVHNNGEGACDWAEWLVDCPFTQRVAHVTLTDEKSSSSGLANSKNEMTVSAKALLTSVNTSRSLNLAAASPRARRQTALARIVPFACLRA